MKKLSFMLSMVLLGATILPAQTFTFTSPAGGERWCRGTTHTIRWTYSGPRAPNVILRLRQGSTGIMTIAPNAANAAGANSFSWPIPATLTAGEYTIRIKTTTDLGLTDSRAFTIAPCGGTPPPPPANTPPVIQVCDPALKAEWIAGNKYNITWKSQGFTGELLNVKLLNSNKVVEKAIALGVADKGACLWQVWETLKDGEYFILVETQNGKISDLSEPFIIKQPTIQIPLIIPFALGYSNRGPLGLAVTNPISCEILKMGTISGVSWRLTCPSSARLNVSLIQNNHLVMPIAENVEACAQGVEWRVGRSAAGATSNLVGTDYRFVVQTPDGINMGVGQPFAIVDWTLAVQTPNSGESWAYGTRQTISWRTSGTAMVANPAYPNLSHLRIDLFQGTGGFVGTIAASAPDTGSYSWTVGDAVDHSGNRVRLTNGTYFVLIYFGGGAGIIEDRSNGNFTITNCPQ